MKNGPNVGDSQEFSPVVSGCGDGETNETVVNYVLFPTATEGNIDQGGFIWKLPHIYFP